MYITVMVRLVPDESVTFTDALNEFLGGLVIEGVVDNKNDEGWVYFLSPYRQTAVRLDAQLQD